MTAVAAPADTLLPTLREDIQLLPGALGDDGAPTWMLYDPARNQFFKLTNRALGLLRLWQPGAPAEALADAARAHGHPTTETEIEWLARYLTENNLIVADRPQDMGRLEYLRARMHSHWLKWLIHHYLFIRIPLFRPDAILERTLPWVAPLFSRAVRRTIRVLGVLGILLVLRQWDQFTSTFMYFFSWNGLLLYGLTLLFVKSAHELGHAYTAKRRGCRIPTMGIAFLVLVPVLYTDATDVWRLPARRDRIAVTLAGVATELHLAMIATFLWSFLPDGALRSAAFFVATTSWITSLTINTSPFMRFDGYYLLSDLLGAENLQPRAFAVARWRLREALFGLGEPPPELLAPWRRRVFIIYAWATWTYRLLLFLGIAMLVYHLVFKLLGIGLFSVEIGWFIVLPLQKELRQWWRRRTRMQLNRRSLRTLAIAAGLIFLLFVPWRSSVSLPAVLVAADDVAIYPPEPAQMVAVRVHAGARVAKGDVLFTLQSPKLQNQMQLVARRLALLNTRLDRYSASPEDLHNLLILQREQAQTLTQLAGLRQRAEQLTLRAPFAGRIRYAASLRPGQWVGGDQRLAELVAPVSTRVVAFVNENDLPRIHPGARGRFIPRDGDNATVTLKTVFVDSTAVTSLSYPALASIYGGPEPVRKLKDGRLRPARALYRVVLEPVDSRPATTQRLPGIAHVAAPPVSIAGRLFRAVAGAFIRQSGF